MRQKFSWMFYSILFFQLVVVSVYSQTIGEYKFGVLAMVGGRYDDMRMCVGSKRGVKGGPIGDVMVVSRYTISNKCTFGVNVPIVRPILFGAAFEMLQFEPEVQIEFKSKASGDQQFSIAPSLGVSFHYGPDYNSDLDNRSESFFAAGPIIGTHFIWSFANKSGLFNNSFGIKPFYVALFSKDNGVGTVVGGAVEYLRMF